jgi:glyoxylase-like metal-dependent hydrolase (beta-lactamase superfamily II)
MDAQSYVDSLPDGPDRSTAQQMAETIAELELRPPTRTFEDRIALAPGCELVTLGGGHTESDAFLVVGDRGVALMGDLLTTRMHPWMGDGDPKQWIEILSAVEAMGLEWFVPGHGAVASLEDVRGLREHLVAFLDDPDGIEARYPDWDFQGVMPDRNRAFLAERTGV